MTTNVFREPLNQRGPSLEGYSLRTQTQAVGAMKIAMLGNDKVAALAWCDVDGGVHVGYRPHVVGRHILLSSDPTKWVPYALLTSALDGFIDVRTRVEDTGLHFGPVLTPAQKSPEFANVPNAAIVYAPVVFFLPGNKAHIEGGITDAGFRDRFREEYGADGGAWLDHVMRANADGTARAHAVWARIPAADRPTVLPTLSSGPVSIYAGQDPYLEVILLSPQIHANSLDVHKGLCGPYVEQEAPPQPPAERLTVQQMMASMGEAFASKQEKADTTTLARGRVMTRGMCVGGTFDFRAQTFVPAPPEEMEAATRAYAETTVAERVAAVRRLVNTNACDRESSIIANFRTMTTHDNKLVEVWVKGLFYREIYGVSR